MKKIAAALASLFLMGGLCALPIGNPSEASLLCDGVFMQGECDIWSIRAGFYGDYVYNDHMEVDRHGNHGSIHDTKIWTNAGYLAFNLYDRLDIFATLGASHLNIHTPRVVFGGSGLNNYVTIETDTDFSWSLGLRTTLWQCNCLGVGVEAQYFRACPQINYVKREGLDPVYPSNEHMKYQAWQVGIGASYRINIASCATALIPYLGIKVAQAWGDMGKFQSTLNSDTTFTFYDLRNERNVGYAFGLTLLGCNRSSVTVEARFVDEKALYVNGQLRF